MGSNLKTTDEDLEVVLEESGKKEPNAFEKALKQAAEEDIKKIEEPIKKRTKELLQVRHDQTGMIFFKFEGGGELPEELSGLYTSPKLADQARDKYLANRRPKK